MNKNTHIVTGNKGFVGLNLTKYFKGVDKPILGISRSPKEDEISYKNVSSTHFNNAKSIIHLAGKAHDLKKTSEDSEYFEVNTELTKTLFNQFLESDCEVFIYMSSVKAAADTVEGFLTENVTPKPVTVYGKSKLAAEQYILSKEISKDKRVYILRPCMIHGENNKGNLNLLYKLIANRIPWFLGSFDNRRSFLSVDNLAFIVKEIMTKKIPSGEYFLADDKSFSTNQLVKLIGESLCKKVTIIKFWSDNIGQTTK